MRRPWAVGEIEDGVPIPPPVRMRSKLRDLEVGQSVLINNYTRERSVHELAYQIGIELDRKSLAELAAREPAAFTKLAEKAKAATAA